jgi:hypothetical protein
MGGCERFWREYVSNLVGGKGKERNLGNIECTRSHTMGPQTINSTSSYGAFLKSTSVDTFSNRSLYLWGRFWSSTNYAGSHTLFFTGPTKDFVFEVALTWPDVVVSGLGVLPSRLVCNELTFICIKETKRKEKKRKVGHYLRCWRLLKKNVFGWAPPLYTVFYIILGVWVSTPYSNTLQ